MDSFPVIPYDVRHVSLIGVPAAWSYIYCEHCSFC